MSETRATFPCDNLSLEGVYNVPDGEGHFAAVVVCHPHPLYGGMMDNNVVIAVCQALAQASIISLRFNFRGVGLSQGQHDNSIGEQDDIGAALSFIASLEQVDRERLGLCGYSFGAGVALDVAARDERVKALALVSPLLSHPSPIESYGKPKLLLWGSRDLALPAADLKSFTDELPEPRQYEIISGADHFWWGYEGEIAPRIATFFTDTLHPDSQS
ncbi:MAG TPA: alpha/beta fold hydrolase [Dehalococcoidia bacterium]|nr:alpha/beta fold hydrolase [Dehalococcoidia bacterium]